MVKSFNAANINFPPATTTNVTFPPTSTVNTRGSGWYVGTDFGSSNSPSDSARIVDLTNKLEKMVKRMENLEKYAEILERLIKEAGIEVPDGSFD